MYSSHDKGYWPRGTNLQVLFHMIANSVTIWERWIHNSVTCVHLRALLIRWIRLQSVSLYFRPFLVPLSSIILTVNRDAKQLVDIAEICWITAFGYFRESYYRWFPFGTNSSNSICLGWYPWQYQDTFLYPE